jgi:hypothetical protein
MSAAYLAIFDNKNGTLTRYKSGIEVPERHLLVAKRRGGMAMPHIQYTPVEKLVVKIVHAFQTKDRIDWSDFKKSTLSKALTALEDLRFIVRKPHSIEVTPKALEFVTHPERRPVLFAEGALKMKSFASFINILNLHKEAGLTLSKLAVELRKTLGVEWTDGTANINAKIMLDWARHIELAPNAFAHTRRGARGESKKKANSQTSLFPIQDEG